MRGKGFTKSGSLWELEAWRDRADSRDADQGLTQMGNLDHPLFIVPDPKEAKAAKRPA